MSYNRKADTVYADEIHRVFSSVKLEKIVGTPSQMILMKATRELDDGSKKVLASASLAAFGYRDANNTPHTTLVGGAKGFPEIHSNVRISFNLDLDQPRPLNDSNASLVFLLLGVGETLRVNGVVVHTTESSVTIDIQEAYVHCARCILRSGLWKEPKTDDQTQSLDIGELSYDDTDCSSRPFADPKIKKFLTTSTFAAVSSWDANGPSDTSPKGDPAGFIRILDDHTIVIPDRNGNRRADTYHNIITCDQISLVVLSHGRDDVLQISGTAYITSDPALLSTMTLSEKAPSAALVVRGLRAEIVPSSAVRMSQMWNQSSLLDVSKTPDLNILATNQLARSKMRGPMAWMVRAFSKGLAKVSPKFMQKMMSKAYAKALKNEGY